MIKGYLASHFFNESGYEYTKNLAKQIRDKVDIDLYVPQENESINDKSANDSDITAKAIAFGDNEYLEDSNILIAVLDGVEIDSGVSAEIGYFAGLSVAEKKMQASSKIRYIVGLYTDIRRDGTGDNRFYINLYTKGLVEIHGEVVNSTKELVEYLQELTRNINHEVHEYGGII